MSQASYEAQEQLIYQKHAELDSKNLFTKIDMQQLEDRVDELKKDKWYHILFGVAVGAIIAIIIIHYTL